MWFRTGYALRGFSFIHSRMASRHSTPGAQQCLISHYYIASSDSDTPMVKPGACPELYLCPRCISEQLVLFLPTKSFGFGKELIRYSATTFGNTYGRYSYLFRWSGSWWWVKLDAKSLTSLQISRVWRQDCQRNTESQGGQPSLSHLEIKKKQINYYFIFI